MGYQEMKAALNARRRCTRYFTKQFYNTFVAEYRQAVDNAANGIYADKYQETKKSNFYNKAGGAYCEFLELFNMYVERCGILGKINVA